MRAAKWLALVLCCGLGISMVNLSGCVLLDTVEFVRPAGDPNDTDIKRAYETIQLNRSTSSDVLTVIHMPKYERLTQSTSVIASQGEKKRGHKVWFNMVAFDENEQTAKRKYRFVQDERPKRLFVDPWESLRFDCAMAVDSDVLSEPYANENARRIAIYNWVVEKFRADIDDFGQDNKKLNISSMMVNQALETFRVKLKASPALAAELSDPLGVEFDHLNMDKGRFQMIVAREIVTVKIRLGSPIKRWKKIESIDDY